MTSTEMNPEELTQRVKWAVHRVDGAWLHPVLGRECWVNGSSVHAEWWTIKPIIKLKADEEWAVRIDLHSSHGSAYNMRGASVTMGQMLAEVATALGLWP